MWSGLIVSAPTLKDLWRIEDKVAAILHNLIVLPKGVFSINEGINLLLIIEIISLASFNNGI